MIVTFIIRFFDILLATGSSWGGTRKRIWIGPSIYASTNDSSAANDPATIGDDVTDDVSGHDETLWAI